MKVGIPRALHYYQYAHLWDNFFDSLGIETVVSPETNKEIFNCGMNYAVDESCLSSKIYLGHAAWLMDRCDMILVPRISNYGKTGEVCTKFQAIYDLVKNTFRGSHINLLHYNIDLKNSEDELVAFMKMGKTLGKQKAQVLLAYLSAKQAEKAAMQTAIKKQEAILKEKKVKILIIAHAYNLYDKFIGFPVLNLLRGLGAIPVLGVHANRKEALACSYSVSETLPWVQSRELVGSAVLYRDSIDGILLMSAFPCGPDSLVNEIILRRIKDKPILNLVLDGQEGTAGLETRLESFLDIIRYKRESIGTR